MLQAGLEAFSELGYDGASTREIASRAGVNQGLVNYYFGCKETLWREAVDRAFSELRAGTDALIAAAPDTSEREQAAQLIRDFVAFAARRPEFSRLMTDEGKRNGPRMQWIVDRHVRPLYDAVGGFMSGALGAGTLPGGLGPALFHYILVGAVTHLYHQAPEFHRLTSRDATAQDVIDAHTEALITLFVGPPQG